VSKVRCPGCELELEESDMRAQAAHMSAEHPEIVAERLAEAARWDGWVND
jgi:hypothetical protein